MELAMLIVTFVAMGAAVASAIVAWYKAFGATAAKEEAESARDTAVSSLERSARALEESNELVRRYAPREEASWEIEISPSKEYSYLLRNVGISTAKSVRISPWPPAAPEEDPVEGLSGQIIPSSMEPRTMPPNDVFQFRAFLFMEDVRLRALIRWVDEAGNGHEVMRDLP